jgi:hypothetical protein
MGTRRRGHRAHDAKDKKCLFDVQLLQLRPLRPHSPSLRRQWPSPWTSNARLALLM